MVHPPRRSRPDDFPHEHDAAFLAVLGGTEYHLVLKEDGGERAGLLVDEILVARGRGDGRAKVRQGKGEGGSAAKGEQVNRGRVALLPSRVSYF